MQVDIKNRQVVVKNAYVVDFLSKNASNKVILQSCDDVLESFCRMTKDLIVRHMEHGQRSQEMNELMMHFKRHNEDMRVAYDTQMKRIEDAVEKTGEDIEERLVDIDETIEKNKCELGEKVANASVSMSNLMTTMTQSITKTLGVEGWSHTIAEKVCKHIELQLESSTTDMLEEVEQCISNAIIPMTDQNQDVLDMIRKLPGELKQPADIAQRLDEMKVSWQSQQAKSSKQIDDLDHKLKEVIIKHVDLKEQGSIQQRNTIDQIKQLPLLTKGILSDALRDIAKQSRDVSNALASTHVNLTALQVSFRDSEMKHASAMTKVHHDNEIVTGHLETIGKQLVKNTYNTKVKGTEGENRMCELLESRLFQRDGYMIQNVSGHPHSTDIVIKREKYPAIRIECKAIGLGTNEKVRYCEVEKFLFDLGQLQDHGLFISLYSGIHGVSNFEIQQLPSGKFAMYLTNNNYDVELVINCMNLIYKLNSITVSYADGEKENRITITSESMVRLQTYLKDYANKISSIKTHMKESMTLLSEIQFDMIEKILLGHQPASTVKHSQPLPTTNRATCDWCKKEYASDKSCANHKRTCAKAPARASASKV